MKQKNTWVGSLEIFICMVLYGLSYMFTKKVTDTTSPFDLLGWRFFIAFFMMVLLGKLHIIKADFKGKNIKPLLLLSVASPIGYYTGETLAISWTSASESSAVIAVVPAVTVILTILVTKTLPPRVKAVGTGISIIGVLISVIDRGLSVSFVPEGYAMLLLAVLSFSAYSVGSQELAHYTAVEKTYVMLGSGAVFFMGIAIVRRVMLGSIGEFLLLPVQDPEFLLAIVYLSIGCSCIAFILNNSAIELIGTYGVTPFSGVCTVVSILSSVLILKESFSAGQLAGVVLIVIGVYVANIPALKALIKKKQ